mgnify:CR=1 FL=1
MMMQATRIPRQQLLVPVPGTTVVLVEVASAVLGDARGLNEDTVLSHASPTGSLPVH